MMERIANKPCRLAVGLMSGTSVDGIDAALVELSGSGDGPKVKLLAFQNTPYPEAVREKIFALFQPKESLFPLPRACFARRFAFWRVRLPVVVLFF